jgi:hypothetical protein
VRRTLLREARLFANPLLKFVKRYILGATFSGDYGYSAYTCLTSACADLTVLSSHPASLQ